MKSVGAYEAKTHLSQLLEQVAKGERVTIEKHGVPIAVMQSANPASRQTTGETVEALRAFRKGRRLKGHSLREMIEEGRR